VSGIPQTLISVGSRPRRVLVLDWHDGPIKGLVGYEPSTTGVFQFDLVGGVSSDSRIYLLRTTRVEAWDKGVAVFAQASPPRWPVWVLGWGTGAPEWRARFEAALPEIIDDAQPIVGLVQAESIRDQVLAVRIISDDQVLSVVRKLLTSGAGHESWSEFLRS
jgi:hypothetical protein